MNTPPLVAQSAPGQPGAVICPTCQKGQLVLKKISRMSAPVVVIGWLLLVPSFLGMLVGVIMLFATGSAVTATSASIDKEARDRLAAASVPAAVADKVVAGQNLAQAEEAALTEDQRTTISSVKLSLTAGKVGAGAGTAIAGGFSIGIIVMAFIGGLLGWLLVMKKKVLQCTVCAAVVAAS